MNKITLTGLAAGALLLATIAANAQTAKISVAMDQPGHKISPTLWGIFFEDINLSADGGIYPELVQNRSFEDAETPENWKFTSTDDKTTATIFTPNYSARSDVTSWMLTPSHPRTTFLCLTRSSITCRAMLLGTANPMP